MTQQLQYILFVLFLFEDTVQCLMRKIQHCGLDINFARPFQINLNLTFYPHEKACQFNNLQLIEYNIVMTLKIFCSKYCLLVLMFVLFACNLRVNGFKPISSLSLMYKRPLISIRLHGSSSSKMSKTPVVGIDDIKQSRIDKVNLIKESGGNPFEYSYKVTHSSSQLQDLYKSLDNGAEDESADVAVAGRIMVRRVFGKLAFFDIQDETGSIQLYLDKSRLENSFQSVKAWTDAGYFHISDLCSHNILSNIQQIFLLHTMDNYSVQVTLLAPEAL